MRNPPVPRCDAGDGGWSMKTPMGRFILRITGYLKDAEDKA